MSACHGAWKVVLELVYLHSTRGVTVTFEKFPVCAIPRTMCIVVGALVHGKWH